MIRNLPNLIGGQLSKLGVSAAYEELALVLVLLTLTLSLCFAVYKLAQSLLVPLISNLIKTSKSLIDDYIVAREIPQRISHLAPALVLYLSGDLIFADFPVWELILHKLGLCLTIVVGARVLSGIINVLLDWSGELPATRDKPMKSYAQVLKLIIYIFVTIAVVSVLIERSPWVLLSSLGAMTAIILLVFKDSILGLVASVQISAYQMVRVGDWIEFEKYGADGDVTEISLNVIKIQNWDKTITTVPTYAFMSESFKNWRGMTNAGGRRIKRSIFIDAQTVGFLDHTLLKRLSSVPLLSSYLERKEKELKNYNAADKGEITNLINGRRLTNLGTFRAYISEYLKSLPNIHPDMTILVRQLQSTDRGIPLEIYAFSRDTRWLQYEGIAGDIFDHLFSVMDQFGLKPYQSPSGSDLKSALSIRHEKAAS